MAIIGTVPRFDVSQTPGPGSTVVTVTGAASGAATGSFSDEALALFLRRAQDALSASGVLSASGATSGMQCFPASVASGMRNMQRELAFRIADLELGGNVGNAARLAHAQAAIAGATSGEFQLGT